MKFIFCIILFVLLTKLAQSATVEIIGDEDAIYVNPDDDVNITCLVEDLGGKTVKWTHSGKDIVLVAGGQTIVFVDPSYEEKYEAKGAELIGGNFTFQIHNVSEKDAGSIGCIVSGNDPAEVLLRIHESLDDVITSYNSPLSPEELKDNKLYIHKTPDQTINLTCLAPQVRPRPVVLWSWKSFTSGDAVQIWKDDPSVEKDFHDNLVYNYSSTLRITQDVFQSFLSNKNENVETTTTTTLTTNTDLSVENLTSSETLALQQIGGINKEIEVICEVIQLNETIRKTFILHLGPPGSSSAANQSYLVLTFFSILQHFLFNYA